LTRSGWLNAPCSAEQDPEGEGIKHRRRSHRFEPLRHDDFRRLWQASFISELGDAMGRVALTIFIQRDTGSAVLTGSVLATAALPHIGLGQWITAKVAHLPRRRVLLTADLLRAACFAAMVLPIGVYPRLGLLFVASVATPPFNAVAAALVARSVPRELIGPAAGLRTGTTELAFIVGFAVGGFLADVSSPISVIGLDAVSFLVSAAIVSRLPAGEPVGSPGVLRFGDGARAIAADPRCRRVLLLTAAAFALVLVPETLVASYTDEVFPDTVGATGAFAAVVALGVIAATWANRPEDDDGLIRHASWLVLAGGAVAAAAFAAPDRLGFAALGYLAIGPVLAIRVHAYSIFSRRIDDLLLAPAWSVSTGAISVAYLVAGFGGGTLTEAIGADQAFVVATSTAVVLGAVSLLVPLRTSAALSSAARG